MNFCPKNAFLQLKHYIQRNLSNIFLNYLCENSPNYLCHFWNHTSFFTTQLFCIFIAQTLHTFYKNSPTKCKFSDLPLLALKFTKFLMSSLEPRVSFSSNFASLFSVIWHITPLKFSNWNILCFGQKEPINVQFFRLLGALMNVHPIPHAIFETTRSG